MSYTLDARRGMWAVLIAMLGATPAMAEVRIGAVGTHNASRMSVADSDHPFPHSTWGGGGVVEVDVTRHLALVSRPTFLGKGSSGPLIVLPGETSSELHLRYLEIPLLVRLSAPGRVAPYFIAGPSLGLRRSASLIRQEYGDDSAHVEDATRDTRPAELTLQAGVGVGLGAGRAYGFFEAVWAQGLTKASETFGRNRGLQLRLGVTVRVGS